MKTQIFVEGGAKGRLAKDLRVAFGSFLQKASAAQGIQITACGSRADTYRKFRGAVRKGESAMLLVDAEQPITTQGPWQHLKQRDNWDRPDGATDDQCHLMVQIMESWFLADPDVLESYYGRGFRKQDLRQNPSVEQVPKQDVLDGLEHAARNTTKGRYSKGKHGFEILARIDPVKVRTASRYANRFIVALTS